MIFFSRFNFKLFVFGVLNVLLSIFKDTILVPEGGSNL